MGLLPILFVALGLLELSSGQWQQPRRDFTKGGELCVAYDGHQAVCEKRILYLANTGHSYWWCYIGFDSWKWERCTAYAATERRCSSNGVTRHYECDIHDDEGYCCSESGWCGNKKDHCKSPGRNLRDEACSGIACGENGECFWDEVQKKADCRCKGNYKYDSSTGQCQECVGNSDCEYHQACFSGTCHGICDGACVTGAYCTPQNHEATCTCNGELKGNPYSGQHNSDCHQCLLDDDCKEDRKCSDDKNCIDPCLNYCKPDNATCTVETHSPLCTCPKDLKPVTETLCQFIADEAADPYVTKVLIPVIFLVILLLVFIAICFWKREYLYSKSRNARATVGSVSGRALASVSERARSAWNYVLAQNSQQDPEVYPIENVVVIGANNDADAIYENSTHKVDNQYIENYLIQAIHSKDIDIEFSNVPRVAANTTFIEASKPINKLMNRYKNILPYDQTRVILSPNEANAIYANVTPTNYINASYIKNNYSRNTYIATQGPKNINENTIEDFWRMIWQEKVSCIIMVANLVENGKSKVSIYWPENANLRLGEFEITSLNHEQKVDYIVREFSITSGGECRKVMHYQFTSWPDHSVPSNPSTLAVMLRDIRNNFSTETCVVHCSAGIGRTGTVLLTLLVLDQIDMTQQMHIPEVLHVLRSCRMNLVDNPDQYRFVHELLLEMMYGRLTSATGQEFLHTFAKTTASALRVQHDKLMNLPQGHTYELASIPSYSQFNRDQTILPADGRMVFLNSIRGANGSQYINAVRVNGFMIKDDLLAMEHPLPHTLSHAWHLVMEQDVAVWILLHSFPVGSESYPQILTSNIPGVNLLTHVVSESIFFKESQVTVETEGSHRPRTISVLELHGWPSDALLPSSPAALLKALVRVTQLTDNSRKVLYSCRDGVSGCGVATSLSLILERYQHLGLIDVFKSVMSVKYDRAQFVNDFEQYQFLYTAVKSHITS